MKRDQASDILKKVKANKGKGREKHEKLAFVPAVEDLNADQKELIDEINEISFEFMSLLDVLGDSQFARNARVSLGEATMWTVATVLVPEE